MSLELYGFTVRKLAKKFSELGYRIDYDNNWIFFIKESTFNLSNQGWKIHVSSTATEFLESLDAVTSVVRKYDASFKIPRTWHAMLSLTTGAVPLVTTGKMITIYPKQKSDIELETIVNELYRTQNNKLFPPIFTDYQYKDSNIFLRYGSFIEQYVLDDKQEPLLALFDESNVLIPDKRVFGAHTPSFVKVPRFITNYFPKRTTMQFPLTQPRLLQRSAKGNIYKVLTPKGPALLKQGYNGSLAVRGNDTSANRVLNEANILHNIPDYVHKPRVLGISTTSDSVFMLESFMPGVSLENIFTSSVLIKTMLDTMIIKIAKNLMNQILEVHRAGVVIRDLSPSNVLVNEYGQVFLVDFEIGSFITSPISFMGSTPGFFPSFLPLTTSRNSFCFDWYSFGAILFYLGTSIKPIFPESRSKLTKKAFFDKLYSINELTLNGHNCYSIACLGISIMENFYEVNDNTITTFFREALQSSNEERNTKISPAIFKISEIVSRTLSKKNTFSSEDIRRGPKEELLLLSLDKGMLGTLLLKALYLDKNDNTNILSDFRRDIAFINRNIDDSNSINLVNGISSLVYILSISKEFDKAQCHMYFNLQIKILNIIRRKVSHVVYNGVLYGLAGIGLSLFLAWDKDCDLFIKEQIKEINELISDLLLRRMITRDKRMHIGIKGVTREDSKVVSDFGFGEIGVASFLALINSSHNQELRTKAIKSSLENLYENRIVEGSSGIKVAQTTGSLKYYPFLFSGISGILIFLELVRSHGCGVEVDESFRERVFQSVIKNTYHNSPFLLNGDAGVLISLMIAKKDSVIEQKRLVALLLSESNLTSTGKRYWSLPGKFTLTKNFFLEGNIGILCVLQLFENMSISSRKEKLK